MNQVAVSGKLVKGIDVRKTSNGSSVVNFTVAVKRPDTRDIVDYLDCVAFDEMAEYIQSKFKKDDWVIVGGYVTTHSNDKDGVKRKFTEIRVKSAELGEAN